MSKFNKGMLVYAAAFLVGIGLLIANFVGHVFDGIRIGLGRKGYFVSRSKKPDQDV
jgi:hypothetical protein